MGKSLSDGKPLDEISNLAKDLEVLESLALRRARRRSVRWVIAAMASLLAVAAILAAIPLGSVDVRIVTDLRAFVMSTADHTENLLIDTVTLKSIVTDGSRGPACWRVGSVPSPTCSVVADLRWNTIALHPTSSVAFRADGACLEVYVVAGSASVNVTSATIGPSNQPQWSAEHMLFPSGDSISICSDTKATLRFNGSSDVVFARRTGDTASDLEFIPSLATGVLAIKTTGASSPLVRTDMLRAGDIRQSLFVATMADPISLTFDGRVGVLGVVNRHGATERSLMPSWLDWIVNSSAIKIVLAVLGAIVSFVFALRERLLSELS